MALVSVAWCTKKHQIWCLAHMRGKLILPPFPFAMSVYLVRQYHVQNIDEQHWTREGEQLLDFGAKVLIIQSMKSVNALFA